MARETPRQWRRKILVLTLCCLLICIFYVYSRTLSNSTHESSHLTTQRDLQVRAPANVAEWAQPTRDAGQQLKLLVFVISAPKSVVLRDAIRETWATLGDPKIVSVTVRFAIGRGSVEHDIEHDLEAEHRLHGDIHRTQSDEGYLHISAKVLRFIAEAVETGYTFDYIIKADDDTWLQMDHIVQELQQKPRERFYWGNIYTNNPRFKNPSDLWYEPNYFSDHYPSYATGGTGYVLSADLARWIARNKDDLVVFTGNEDAMVGTWCAAHRGVPAMHDHRFIQLYGTDQCMNVPLGVHLGPYPVKWPHGTIAATMREYFKNYLATSSVCGDHGQSAEVRMIAMADRKQNGDTWYRIASFASGDCLAVNGLHASNIAWQGCSQYHAQQQQQQFKIDKLKSGGWRLSPKLSPSKCITVTNAGFVALSSCSAETTALTWSEVPPTTGTPGRMRHSTGRCMSKRSVGAGHPSLRECQ